MIKYEVTKCQCYQGQKDENGNILFNKCLLTNKPCEKSTCIIKTALVNYHNKGVGAQNVSLFVDVGFSMIKTKGE